MNQNAYHQFTESLIANLAADERVLGLVAMGSMARQDYQPDQWSDHDFFVVVSPGAQPEFRRNLRWLPAAETIALAFPETAHGVKVVYASGHLLEFAVFAPEELNVVSANRYRVLLDRANLAQTMAARAEATAVDHKNNPLTTDLYYFGQFLTGLLVGNGRYRRGERLSGHVFIKDYATRHLLTLLARHLPAPNHALLDNLDPFRRFERVYPELGAEINELQLLPPPETAVGLLAIARRELANRLDNYPETAVETIAAQLVG